MRGKQRLDLGVNPPPDLAREIDITSCTDLDTYTALGVSELWRRSGNQIQIPVLQAGHYVEVSHSAIFLTCR